MGTNGTTWASAATNLGSFGASPVVNGSVYLKNMATGEVLDMVWHTAEVLEAGSDLVSKGGDVVLTKPVPDLALPQRRPLGSAVAASPAVLAAAAQRARRLEKEPAVAQRRQGQPADTLFSKRLDNPLFIVLQLVAVDDEVAVDGVDVVATGIHLRLATHGGAARAAIGALLGLPIEHWAALGVLANCAWSVLEENTSVHGPAWRLQEYNAGSLPVTALADDR